MRNSAAKAAVAAALVASLLSTDAIFGEVWAQSSGPLRLTPNRQGDPTTGGPPANVLVPPPGAVPTVPSTAPTEESRPQVLTPPPYAVPTSPSGVVVVPASPARPLPTAPAQLTPRAPGSAPAGFQVNPLQAVDADALGVLSPEDGGLPPTLWRGTPRPLAERLIGLLPAVSDSRVMHDLSRRLLLSAALLPEGAPAEPRLLALRGAKLAEIGELEGLDRLLKAVPPRVNDPGLARLRLDVAYLQGDGAAACAELRNATGRDEAVQRAQAFCQAVAGDSGKAELSLRLMSEQGFKPDPAYDALMESLVHGGKPRLTSLKDPRPIDVALLRAAKQPAPADAAGAKSPAIWQALADSPETDTNQRLLFAEKLEAAGVWSVERRARLIAAVELPADALQNPLSRADGDASARGRAILRRALDRQQTPLARAQVIDKALTLGAKNGVYAGEARLYAPSIAQMVPSADLAWFAPAASRALLAADRTAALRGWMRLMPQPRDDAGRDLADRVWALARLSGGETLEQWQGPRLEAWARRVKDRPEEASRLARLLGLFEAVGEPVDGRLWRDLVVDGDRRPVGMPPPALLPALARAAEQERLGEGIALAALAFGETRLGDLPPPVVAPVVAHLSRLGLTVEARALAVEAAVAAGL
jgi:hypothetical protein